MLTQEEKQKRKEARAEARKAEKRAQEIQEHKSQKPVKSISIAVEWVRSRTWGHNPNATAEIRFADGTFKRVDGFRCSGCGYDKESSVIAQVFNAFLRYKLYENRDFTNAPYGIRIWDGRGHYEGGVGTSCYNDISKFIGGEFKKIGSGKSFDCFQYVNND